METNDNTNKEHNDYYQPSKRLRLRVASMAMQGYIASGQYHSPLQVAKLAVRMADTLLAELNKKES